MSPPLLRPSPVLSPSTPILTLDRTPLLLPPSYYSSSHSSASSPQHLHPSVTLLLFSHPLRYSPLDLTPFLSSTPFLIPPSSLSPLALFHRPPTKLRPSAAVPYFAVSYPYNPDLRSGLLELRTPTSGALLPFHHFLLADSQEVIPPPAQTPPSVRLRNIPGPTPTSTPSRRVRKTYAPDSGPPLRYPVHVSSPEPPVLAPTSDFDPTSAYTHCIG
ncbi:uncharacterized protein EI90DRAFT_3119943 [Cantharellus anzutake]|uniref:uncharacterized protein n=1 Tax=Cantharellus anzutake TaxID=1750568 RepID=UPI00190840E7|nr:uncharacterized protein EI90DRAFT_3119943 [Cantharellus anzutake]KAF8335674.1 hypothetical protein EI90DRAFT_3119943 [Cantharellus anzutake]